MKNINKSISLLFFFSLLSSIGFPGGVVLLVLGATQDITFMMVIGIVLTVVCFFAIPLLWIFYGLMRGDRNLINLITSTQVESLYVISQTSGIHISQLAGKLNSLIMKGYLSDYTLIGDFIVNKDAENYNEIIARKTGNVHTVKCPSCGAYNELFYGSGVCGYCGTPLNKNEIIEN